MRKKNTTNQYWRMITMESKMQIRIPKEQYEEFKRIAKENSQVPSMLVRKWIEEYIEKNNKN